MSGQYKIPESVTRRLPNTVGTSGELMREERYNIDVSRLGFFSFCHSFHSHFRTVMSLMYSLDEMKKCKYAKKDIFNLNILHNIGAIGS